MRALLVQLNNRIEGYEKDRAEHTSMSSLMLMQHKVVQRKGFSPIKKMWSHEDDLPAIEGGGGSVGSANSKAIGSSKKSGAGLAIEDRNDEPDTLPLPDDDDSVNSHHIAMLEEAQRKAAEMEREALKAAHGVETLAEKAERERNKKEEDEERMLMSISLEKEREDAEEKKKKDRLMLETFEPTLGVLRSERNEDGHVVEEVRYR
jgi:hypothetical protein